MRKLLIAAAAVYMLGVVGVGGGSMARNWSSDWGFGDQVASAFWVGMSWPSLIVGMVTRA